MIECREVSKHFGDLAAVDRVSLKTTGGIFALLGPNGAGKSTLLKMLTGLLRPDSGEVAIDGLNVFGKLSESRQIMGVVPEDLGLFDSLTIQEHLELSGPIYGLAMPETRLRAESLLKMLGLTAGRHTFLDQCSHGMRKKTALPMALLHNPRVVFLDEPFEGIDPVSARTIRDLLRTLAARGITVFFTSHILSIVSDVATSIAMIRAGRIAWDSSRGDTRPLEEIYFELIDAPAVEDLPWLRFERS